MQRVGARLSTQPPCCGYDPADVSLFSNLVVWATWLPYSDYYSVYISKYQRISVRYAILVVGYLFAVVVAVSYICFTWHHESSLYLVGYTALLAGVGFESRSAEYDYDHQVSVPPV